jgi:hypothetical protein
MRGVPNAAIAVVLICLAADGANAQEREPATPRVSVGLGMGTGWGEGSPAALLSIQVPLSRYLLIEGEMTRRSIQLDSDVTTAAANLVFTVRSNRVTTFAGAGLGAHRTTTQFRYPIPVVCAPPDSFFCQLQASGHHSGLIAQALGGAEVSFASRWGVFGTLHAGTAPEHGIRLFSGMRVGLFLQPPVQRDRSQPIRDAAGKEIRVTLANGEQQTGRLVALSAADLTFITGDDKRHSTILSLSDARKVETVSHHARTGALVGAAAGGLMIALAYSGDCADCEDRRIAFFYPPVFTGVGAAIGGMINAATANRHVLYEASSTSVSVQPAVSLGATRLNVMVRW